MRGEPGDREVAPGAGGGRWRRVRGACAVLLLHVLLLLVVVLLVVLVAAQAEAGPVLACRPRLKPGGWPRQLLLLLIAAPAPR